MKTLEQLGISPAPWVKGDTPAQWDVFSQHQDNWIGIGFVSQSVNHEADARLIAAAPDLYKSLLGLLEIVCVDCNSAYKVDGKCVKCPRVVAAKAALEKAGGLK